MEKYQLHNFMEKNITLVKATRDFSMIFVCIDDYNWGLFKFEQDSESYELVGKMKKES